MTAHEKLLALIHSRPGLTERELAKSLHGSTAVQQQVNQQCRAIVSAGLVERRGSGGSLDPFRYHPLGEKPAPFNPNGSQPTNVASTSDPMFDWYWEGNIVEVVVRFLESEGWKIEALADTKTKQTGVDIQATKGNRLLLIEAKGYPSKGYRDPRRAAEVKPTSQTNQAQHWYSHALLKVMRMQSKHREALVAMALPDFPRYRTLFQETMASLEKLGIGLITVTTDGNVSVWGIDEIGN